MKHTCHWPGCHKEILPKLAMCPTHWFRLPKKLRDLIWATYRPGQEVDKKPSEAYTAAALTVRAWIKEHYG
jgi:hypothetical protein